MALYRVAVRFIAANQFPLQPSGVRNAGPLPLGVNVALCASTPI